MDILTSKIAILDTKEISRDLEERLSGKHAFESTTTNYKLYNVEVLYRDIINNKEDDTNETVKYELEIILDEVKKVGVFDYIALPNDYL